MRGQATALVLLSLGLLSLLFVYAAMPSLQNGITHALTGVDTLTQAQILLLPALFVFGALFWTFAFLKTKYGGL